MQVGKALEAIIAEVARIPLAAVASGEQNVGHLARGDEVQRFLSVGRAIDQRGKKVAEAIADHGVFLGRVHAMAKHFDEQPVRTPGNVDLRLFPKSHTMQRWRIGSRNRAVFEHGPRRTHAALQVGYERSLHDQRQRFGHAPNSQVVSLAVWRGLIERESTFVNGIGFCNLRAMPDSALGMLRST